MLRKKKLHPSASPMSALVTMRSSDELKPRDSTTPLGTRLSAVSQGTPSRQGTLGTQQSDLSSGGQLLSDRSISDTGATMH